MKNQKTNQHYYDKEKKQINKSIKIKAYNTYKLNKYSKLENLNYNERRLLTG